MKIEELNVLIVDDVQTVRKVLVKTLKELGVTRIATRDSMESAWKVIIENFEDDNKFDIVFCDWNMPGGDGIELLKKIRDFEDDKLRWTKFVMVTGSEEKVRISMDQGANNVIHKPFNKHIIKLKLDIMYRG